MNCGHGWTGTNLAPYQSGPIKTCGRASARSHDPLPAVLCIVVEAVARAFLGYSARLSRVSPPNTIDISHSTWSWPASFDCRNALMLKGIDFRCFCDAQYCGAIASPIYQGWPARCQAIGA